MALIVEDRLVNDFDIQRALLTAVGAFIHSRKAIGSIEARSAHPGTASGASMNVDQGKIRFRYIPMIHKDHLGILPSSYSILLDIDLGGPTGVGSIMQIGA